MAKQEQIERLKRNVDEWNEWRRERPDLLPDLKGANLSWGNLMGADLNKANLSYANLSYTHLNGANFNGANLNGAYLIGAYLSRTDLSYANLNEAYLTGAYLNMTNLNGANLTEAHFLYTTFAWVDLSSAKGVELARHDGPSTVNINSVILPHNEHIRQHFLRNTGFADIFADYLPSLLNIPTQYYSLFLSYSHHDQTFTKRLHHDLQNQGVRCWFAPHDLQAGMPVLRGIENALFMHEKLLLILSKDSFRSNWIQQEVEATLSKEVAINQEIIFPIRLDNTLLESETLWAKRLCQRRIVDFTGWQDDEVYQQAFTTLLQHLQKSLD